MARRTATSHPFRRIARAAVTVGAALTAALVTASPALADEGPPPDSPLVSAAGAPESQYTGTDMQITGNFAGTVIQLVDKDWSAWFTRAGLTEPQVAYRLIEPGQTFTSQCSGPDGAPLVVATDYANAFFCPVDVDGPNHGTIVVPLTALRRIWDGDLYERSVKDAGDFTAATVLAHEFGHHVVDELVRQGVYPAEPATPKDKELIADCFAGNWVSAAYGHGYLGSDPQAAITQAVTALQTLGDENLNSPTHHGTPDERSNAIRIGIYGTQHNPIPGLPQNCMTTFWH